MLSRVSLLLFLPAVAFAFPRELPHQGRLVDDLGAPVNGAHTLDFALYATSGGATSLWSEQIDATLSDGYYSVVLGSTPGNPLQDAWFVDNPAIYLGITVDIALPSDELEPRTQLVATPFAIVAGSVSGGNVEVGGHLSLGTVADTACGSGAPAGTEVNAGTLRWANGGVEVCDGTSWTGLGTASGANGSSPATASSSCNQLHIEHPALGSSTYYLDTDVIGGGSAAFLAFCDMETDGGGWTWVLHSNVNGSHAGSTTYASSGGYHFTNVPSHNQIGLFLYRSGVLEAGISGDKLVTFDATAYGTPLLDHGGATWERWTSAWATFTGKTAASCLHGTYQGICVRDSGTPHVGTCGTAASSFSHPNSNSSWVNHSSCSSGFKTDVNLIIGVR